MFAMKQYNQLKKKPSATSYNNPDTIQQGENYST